jgi:uncharacterized membrane protein YbaN (DUF454 family)
MTRWLLIILGWLAVVLATLGVVLPLLPTTPISVTGCLVLCTFFTAFSSLVAVSLLVRFLFASLATA